MTTKHHRPAQPGAAHDGRDAPPQDPKNPASKPHATTQDQVANMESEGQAQQPGQEPPPEPREDVDQGRPRKKR